MFNQLTLDSYDPIAHLKPVAPLTRTEIAHVCDENVSQSRVFFDRQHVLTFQFDYATATLAYECVDPDLLFTAATAEPVVNVEHFLALCMSAAAMLSADAFSD